MKPLHFLCLMLCLGVSSCQTPLTVQEQRKISQVFTWTPNGYTLDARQGLVCVNPWSPYRDGVRPQRGYSWESSDLNDFQAIPYQGGPYRNFPKYPLLASPSDPPPPWVARPPAPSVPEISAPKWQGNREQEETAPPFEAPPPVQKSTPRQKPVKNEPLPPSPPPVNLPRDKPV